LGGAAHWGEDVRRVVVFRVDAIAWGFLLSILLMRTKILLRIRLVWIACGFLIVTVTSILLTSQAAGSPMIEAAFPFYTAVFGALAIALALKIEPMFRKSSTWTGAAEFLGRISYSVYLFHLLVLGAISPLGGPLALQLVGFIGLTVTIAFLVYTAIEAPILARRPRFLSEANSLIGEPRLPSQI
jgi:peptidoglycan/LPS O-acetylase OafA/YrhL